MMAKKKPPTPEEIEADASRILAEGAIEEAEAAEDRMGVAARKLQERQNKLGVDPAAEQAHREATRRRHAIADALFCAGHGSPKRNERTGELVFRKSRLNGRVITIDANGTVLTDEPIPGRASALLGVELDDERTGR